MDSVEAGVERFLVGVDGGGTGTRVVLAQADGRVLGRGESGPSGLAHGAEAAWNAIQAALSEAGRSAGQAPRPAECALAAGLAGVNHPAWLAAFIDRNPGFARLATCSDAEAALLDAHCGGAGVLVVSGTGSAGIAQHADGSRHCAGGWGFPVGDEGSGAWLGLGAMRIAQCALDRRAPAGALARAVWRQCGSRHDTLLAWSLDAGQTAYADLAPLVFECAAADASAERLLAEAATALETLAQALDPQARLPVVFSGSIAVRLFERSSAALRARGRCGGVDAAAGALALLRCGQPGATEQPA